MEREQALRIIETLLYMTGHPLTGKEIVDVLEMKSYDENDVSVMVQEIAEKYKSAHSPLHVVEVAGGVQMATHTDMAPWIRKLFKERLTVRLSPSALETLSIIAYKQPITKADVELIRGVEASGVIDTLLERRLLKVVGRKESLGRPLLYGTTPEFLRQFGLKHLMDLPDINSMQVSSSDQQQEFLNMNNENIEPAPVETSVNAPSDASVDIPHETELEPVAAPSDDKVTTLSEPSEPNENA